MPLEYYSPEKHAVWSVPYQPNFVQPQMLPRVPKWWFIKKSYVMLHLEAEWPSKQNILIADTILAEPGP